MLRAMDSAVAGLRAHQNKMDVVGHNIANVNTYGFKAQTYTFKEAMYQTSTASTGNSGSAGGVNPAQYGYGTLMGTIGMDMTASTPTYVGGFNASINGEGFFITKKELIQDGVDTSSFVSNGFDYTRVGQFTVDSQGYIVDGNGNFVYGFQSDSKKVTTGEIPDDAKLMPLRAPKKVTTTNKSATGTPGNPGYVAATSETEAEFDVNPDEKVLQLSNISIDNNGKIAASLDVEVITDGNDPEIVSKTIYLGTVAIATFQNPNGLTKKGGNYYNATAGDNTGQSSATIPGGAVSDLMTGYIEASNVDLAKEFADMITTHRGFQANSKMITVSDEMLSDLVAMKR